MTDTDMQQDVLRVERLTVSLKQTGAATVRDISFSIKAGETLCVVGESGSGKSVTSLAVMGLLDPAALAVTAGRIVVDGTDVLAASREDLQKMRATRMSMVFQEPMTALNPVETVGAQVEEVLRVHGETDRTKRRKRVLEMFEAVHLPEPERIYTSYPHQLSGGQRQRIVISMALIMRPKLLIADEPTTALDVTTQRQILLLIGELQKRYGTAVLFITHDFGVVSEIADRIVVMNRGDMVEIGSRDAVLANPKQDYTRMLVASVPSLSPAGKNQPGRFRSAAGHGSHQGLCIRRVLFRQASGGCAEADGSRSPARRDLRRRWRIRLRKDDFRPLPDPPDPAFGRLDPA